MKHSYSILDRLHQGQQYRCLFEATSCGPDQFNFGRQSFLDPTLHSCSETQICKVNHVDIKENSKIRPSGLHYFKQPGDFFQQIPPKSKHLICIINLTYHEARNQHLIDVDSLQLSSRPTNNKIFKEKVEIGF